MKKIVFILLSALSISIQAQTVKIAAAGNLKDVLQEIIQKYKTVNPNAKIVVNLASSGTLYQQILNGADFDLFMAADKIYPDKLKAQGVVKGQVHTYAFGKLVLWSNTVDVSKGLSVLGDKSVNKIAIAKPETAPYGNRAVECLKYYKLFDTYKDKFVYADNIAQTAQFAQTGNAQVAFIALALTMAPGMKGTYYEIDSKSYKPVEQAMVLVKTWEKNPEAAKFMKYVLSAECNPLFEKYGFTLPK